MFAEVRHLNELFNLAGPDFTVQDGLNQVERYSITNGLATIRPVCSRTSLRILCIRKLVLIAGGAVRIVCVGCAARNIPIYLSVCLSVCVSVCICVCVCTRVRACVCDIHIHTSLRTYIASNASKLPHPHVQLMARQQTALVCNASVVFCRRSTSQCGWNGKLGPASLGKQLLAWCCWLRWRYCKWAVPAGGIYTYHSLYIQQQNRHAYMNIYI